MFYDNTKELEHIAELEEQLADAQRALDVERRERHAVEQIAGQALGYPWFKDDQENFPEQTQQALADTEGQEGA